MLDKYFEATFTLEQLRDGSGGPWLGHTSPQTTEVYTLVDAAEKLEAINKLAPPKIKPGRFRPPDKLLDMLKR